MLGEHKRLANLINLDWALPVTYMACKRVMTTPYST